MMQSSRTIVLGAAALLAGWTILGQAQDEAKRTPAGDAPRKQNLQIILKGREGHLKPGDDAPDFKLKLQNGKGEVQLAELLKDGKPVVLVFGSYSCGPFRNAFGGVNDEYKKHQDHAHFYLIYTKEAHPSDGTKHSATEGKRLPGNDRLGITIKQHATETERQEAAGTCSAKLDIPFPVLLDTLDDKYGLEYSGFPSRIYIIEPNGKIAYKSGPGPFGFKPQEISDALQPVVDEPVISKE